MGFLAVILFIGRPLGLSWFIFITTLAAVLIAIARKVSIRAARRNLWLWPVLFFFAAMVFLRANELLTFLNMMASLCLLAFAYFYYAAGSAVHISLSGVLSLPLRMLGQSLRAGAPLIMAEIAPQKGSHGRRHELLPLLRGGALALPLLAIFAFLLASADLVFSTYLKRLIGIDFASVSPIIGRTLFAGLVTLLVTGATAVALRRGQSDAEEESLLEAIAQQLPRRHSLGAIESWTIILSLSGLFFAFMLLQFTYLFGGQANIGREGFTYAEYARRGFFELVLVASLSLALILVLNWITRRESKRQIKWFNTFSSLLIGLVLLLLVTAFWRMRLYEQAYGYTELRLIVLVFECWLAILLLWFLWTLWRKPDQFAIGLMLAALGFVATLNLLNPDALIVRHNMRRYHETGDLDIHYLARLSADAVPDLVDAYPVLATDEQLVHAPWCREDECARTLAEILGDNLQARYERMQDDRRRQNPLAYHQARSRAIQSLLRFHGQW